MSDFYVRRPGLWGLVSTKSGCIVGFSLQKETRVLLENETNLWCLLGVDVFFGGFEQFSQRICFFVTLPSSISEKTAVHGSITAARHKQKSAPAA